MNKLVLERSVLIVSGAALLLCWFPRLWFGSDGRLRRVIHLSAWAAAVSLLVFNSLAREIYDDEVFYFTQACAAQRGEVSGCLPMRFWMYYPYLALHLSPSATLLAARISMTVLIILAGVAVTAIARKADGTGFSASMAGALSIAAFANLPMGSLVPEYPAFLFLIGAVWLMVAAPGRWPLLPCVFLAGMLLALASATSPRFLLLGAAGFIALFVEPGRSSRTRTLVWAALGMIAGLLPTGIYILAKDSIASLVYWNYTIMRKIGLMDFGAPLEFPAVVAALAAAGSFLLWRARRSLEGGRTLILLWGTAAVSAILNPLKFEYTLGPCLALSFIVAAPAMSAILAGWTRPANHRAYAFVLCLVFFTLVVPEAELLADPASIRDSVEEMNSGLKLIDWLEKTANGNPVACVPPFQPIRSPNAWRMWNVIYYCYVEDPRLNAELDPRLVSTLRSGRAAIVQWDPWPGESKQPNILHYLVSRRFVTQDGIAALAEDLRRSYRLVEWDGPLPDEFGGGRFLVRRDIPVDDEVSQLDDSLIRQK